jgi:hypothetical protein
MTIRRLTSWAGLVLGLMLFSPQLVSADEAPQGFTPSESFQTWVTDLVREQLPLHYEKTKNWGRTKKIFAGWRVEQDGLRIETRRRWKEVNDGTWTRYRVTPLNPDKHFAVRVEKIEPLAGNKVRIDLSAASKVHLLGRLSQWESGVQLVSLSAEAEAEIFVKGTVEIALTLDPTKLPPDVMLTPTVTSADAQIGAFTLRRVSKFDGPLVRSLSDETRDFLAAELADRRPKLVASLNKQIAKQQDKLRFSLSDLLKSEWAKFAPAELTAGAAKPQE